MKNLLILGAAALLVAGLASTVSAGDFAGAVPAATLNSMGFGGVEIMSDDAGLAVRGKGSFAAVWGKSSASYHDRNGHAHSSNNYVAGAKNHYGGSKAAGGSESFAGRVNEYGRHSSSTLIVSGGSAWAYAR
jgi:hypothetical protein